jgi:hypothetical protein
MSNRIELEKQFVELAFIRYNQDRPHPATSTDDPNFQSYLITLLWGSIPASELESWVEYFQKAIKESELA